MSHRLSKKLISAEYYIPGSFARVEQGFTSNGYYRCILESLTEPTAPLEEHRNFRFIGTRIAPKSLNRNLLMPGGLDCNYERRSCLLTATLD